MSYLGNASVVPHFQFVNCNLMVVLQGETNNIDSKQSTFELNVFVLVQHKEINFVVLFMLHAQNI